MQQEQRRTRAGESRESSSNRPRRWMPASTIPTVNDRPGWVHQWVAVTVNGEHSFGASARFSEGFEPCDPAEYPEVIANSRIKSGNEIVHGGLMLCRIPTEMAEQRAEYYSELNANARSISQAKALSLPGEALSTLGRITKNELQFGTGD